MRTTALLLCCAALAGCQNQTDAWQTATMPDAQFTDTFQAVQSVLSDEYTIAQSDPVQGLIRTEYREFQMTGDQRLAGAYISGGAAQQYRRRATCRISRAPGGGSAIELRVDLQREGSGQAETLLIGTEGGDRREAGAPRQWRYEDPRAPVYWADIGRDSDAENKLLDTIRQRLQEPAGDGQE